MKSTSGGVISMAKDFGVSMEVVQLDSNTAIGIAYRGQGGCCGHIKVQHLQSNLAAMP